MVPEFEGGGALRLRHFRHAGFDADGEVFVPCPAVNQEGRLAVAQRLERGLDLQKRPQHPLEAEDGIALGVPEAAILRRHGEEIEAGLVEGGDGEAQLRILDRFKNGEDHFFTGVGIDGLEIAQAAFPADGKETPERLALERGERPAAPGTKDVVEFIRLMRRIAGFAPEQPFDGFERLRILRRNLPDIQDIFGVGTETVPDVGEVEAETVLQTRRFERKIAVALALAAQQAEIGFTRDHIVESLVHTVDHIALRARVARDGDVADTAAAKGFPSRRNGIVIQADGGLDGVPFHNAEVVVTGVIPGLVQFGQQGHKIALGLGVVVAEKDLVEERDELLVVFGRGPARVNVAGNINQHPFAKSL
ncbi:MAG: hypothetical protein BWY37_02040 [Firmicutes bacterium ADurb.Bin262]|nr:MAG: hypothetical protein BWY37_02040 [Firmicutes bacterium ADurb.Bin262]